MQVLLNFQSNALKFTEKGKVEIEVRMINLEDSQYLQISIIDSGIGIPECD